MFYHSVTGNRWWHEDILTVMYNNIYLQFITFLARDGRMKTPMRVSADSFSLCLCVKFFGCWGFRCHGDDLYPLKCSKARNISVIEFDNRAWLPPIHQPKCAFSCLAKPPSGALKSQQTPGTPSLQEGFEGCGEERENKRWWGGGRGGMCQKQIMSRPFLQKETRMTYTHKQIDFEMSTSACCLTLRWQIGRTQIEVDAPRENR